MVVPFPDNSSRTLSAVIAGHRRLLRMTADDARRRVRSEPTFDRGRYEPKATIVPLGLRLAHAAATFGAGTMSLH
jgi:hypothetical protein